MVFKTKNLKYKYITENRKHFKKTNALALIAAASFLGKRKHLN